MHSAIAAQDPLVAALFEAAKVIENPWDRIRAIERAAKLLAIYATGGLLLDADAKRLLGISDEEVPDPIVEFCEGLKRALTAPLTPSQRDELDRNMKRIDAELWRDSLHPRSTAERAHTSPEPAPDRESAPQPSAEAIAAPDCLPR
jgi:hypothetical protein